MRTSIQPTPRPDLYLLLLSFLLQHNKTKRLEKELKRKQNLSSFIIQQSWSAWKDNYRSILHQCLKAHSRTEDECLPNGIKEISVDKDPGEITNKPVPYNYQACLNQKLPQTIQLPLYMFMVRNV